MLIKPARSSPLEPEPRPLAGLLRLHLAVARRRMGVQGGKEPACGVRHLSDRAIESHLVRLRWPVEAGELSDKLQRGGLDLVLARRRFEIEQRLDVAAHGPFLRLVALGCPFPSPPRPR